jgi:hypothetical protein
MRGVLRVLAVLFVLAPHGVRAADEKIHIELNTAETAEQHRCRMNFVVENKTADALDSMKLDIVVFGQDGGIRRRLIAEMGPVRPQKTIVKIFLVEDECSTISALLVNDVSACAPAAPAACLDGLTLSSRMKEIRLYK